jgi:hypothetical protein
LGDHEPATFKEFRNQVLRLLATADKQLTQPAARDALKTLALQRLGARDEAELAGLSAT